MTRDEIIEMAVMNGFYKNDAGTITSPFIEDVDISRLLLNFAEDVEAKKRNDTLEEVAQEFDKMKVFGDTAASFAIFVREMKNG